MASRISYRNGKAEFAYTGQDPWWGIATKVEHHMGVAEAFAQVLPWTVSLREVAYKGYAGQLVNHGGNVRVIARDDDDTPLGVATLTYHAIQNSQAGEIVEALVAEGAECIETIGALDEGARCFALVALDKSGFEVRPGDTVLPYFLLAWGHDGRHPVAGKLTHVRVVCHNTLTAAGFGEGRWRQASGFAFKHNASAKLRIEEAREALGLARKAVEVTQEAYAALAATRISPAQATGYFAGVLPAPIDAGPYADLTPAQEASLERWEAVQARLLTLYEGGKGAVPGTAWGAYNAVTEYLDHVYPVLANGTVSTARQQSVLFGAYADTRDDAYESALALGG
jgi:phage/plasmid-like protein (TIGR03299 family)